jgi:hypothetical protein
MNRRQLLSREKRKLERLAESAVETESPTELERINLEAVRLTTKIQDLEASLKK